MPTPRSPALRVLLDRLIDYAGMYPPASLPRDAAVANYLVYRDSPRAWMLRWLVVGSADLRGVPADLNGSLAVVGDTDEPRAAVIEARRVFSASRPVYCEIPIAELHAVQAAGLFAKLRTGGVRPEMIPSIEGVADFLRACADRRIAFKATAGLHHPVRAARALTYDKDPPRAVMHGFLNVFAAAALAWHGDRDLEPVLAETNPAAFRFDDHLRWRDRTLTTDQVLDARRDFAHSFGSCSFTEPVEGLQALGLL